MAAHPARSIGSDAVCAIPLQPGAFIVQHPRLVGSILKNEPDIGAHGSAPKDPWFHNYLIFKRTGTVGTEQSPHGPYLPTSCDERVLARIQFWREGGP